MDLSVLTPAQEFEFQFRRMAAMIRVAMPGTIDSFNASTQRASVKPGIKMKTILNGEVKYTDLPLIRDAPVVIPMGFGGNSCITFPINSGDPCLLIFADRALDGFLQTGKSENPGGQENEDVTTPRSHHLTDAICIPGLIAEPQAVPSWNNNAIEIRDKNRNNYFSFEPGAGLTMQTSGLPVVINTAGAGRAAAPITIIGSNIAIDGRGGADGTMTITNSLKSTNGTFIDKNGRDSSNHRHGGVQTGSGNTGPTSS